MKEKKPNKPSCFSTKIDLSQKDILLRDLIESGFEISHPIHTIFCAKKKKLVCTLYESGALTVQGKDKDEWIEFYLEPNILKNFDYTHPEINIDFTARIGVDEAGKGDFFGPLCVASFFADEAIIRKLLSLGLKDSKKMSDKKILTVGKKLKEFPHKILRIFPKKYNELYLRFKNLNHLLGWAHASAIADLVKQTNCTNVLIDQFAHESIVLSAVKKKDLPNIHLTQKHRAEEDIVVAAASILARCAFLESMEYLSKELSLELPKGASSKVIEIGKRIVNRYGAEKLEEVAKIHFKTHSEILSE